MGGGSKVIAGETKDVEVGTKSKEDSQLGDEWLIIDMFYFSFIL